MPIEIYFEVMRIIFFLIFIGLIVAIGFLIAFFWAVKDGQFDDEYTPSVRMLFDDKVPNKSGDGNVNKGKNNDF